MGDSALTVVRAAPWQALVRRLDAAVARDPRLIEARDVVLRPVELLRIMATDAHGALADDVLRADRLRAMLFVAWPYIAVALEARKLLAAKTPPASPDTALLGELIRPSAGAHEPMWPELQPYDPGVIDHAGLLVLALAAARVADPPFAPVFVASIQGLALAASAAEVLGRLDPRQPDADSLDVVLQTLYMLEAARTVTRNEFLRPFVFDPVERGRWRCLAELMESPLIETALRMGRAWDAATSDEILGLAPKRARAGETITVRVRGGNPLGHAKVVFASPDGPVHEAAATLGTTTSEVTTIRVVVPEGAPPGWIGFARSDLSAASNEARGTLRRLLAKQLQHACVDGVERIDPARSVPDYPTIATPRRRGTNRFEGGVPAVVEVSATPERVRPGEIVTLRWETAGADAVRIAVPGTPTIDRDEPTGKLEIVAPGADGDVTISVTARATHAGHTVVGAIATARFSVDARVKIAAIEVSQNGRTTPLFADRPLDVVAQLDGPVTIARAQLLAGDMVLEPASIALGRVTFVVPRELVRDGMTLSATIEDRTAERDTRSVGPLSMRARIRAEIILVRPAIVPRATKSADSPIDPPIALDSAHALVIAAAESSGITATVVDLPWADDALAVLAGRPEGDSDPMLFRVLEALSRRALTTPRCEHAIWLALLPELERTPAGLRVAMVTASVPFASIGRWAPANAARAVAVATPSGLLRLFAGLFPIDAKPDQPIAVGPRLAILGTLDDDDLVIDSVRVDERGAGPGAPTATLLHAVTLDIEGRELDQVPLRALTASRPAAISVLVPVSASVGSIEIRDDRGMVHKVIRRVPGELTVWVDAVEGTRPRAFTWGWRHTRNAQPTATLVIRSNGVETPVLEVDPCVTNLDLPLWRFASAEHLLLHATDGWNTAEKSVTAEPFINAAPVVLRRLSDGRFFADAPAEGSVTWRLDGTQRKEHTRTLELGPQEDGMLELIVRHNGATVRDVLRIHR